jgi:hypothetical protein
MDYDFDYTDWGLELVLQTEAYDYEWDIFTVFKESATEYYYWIEEGGCSCHGPLEDITAKSDFTRGTKQELTNAFKTWLGSDEDRDMWSLRPKGNDRIKYLEELSRI